MLIRKNNPKGLDAQIDLLQQELQEYISRTYFGAGLQDLEFIIYPRCYRNATPAPGTGFIAELYTGEGQYKEVFYNDELKLSAFFGTSPKIEHGANDETEVHLVFFAKLSALYPTITHRADYEIKRDLQNLFEGTRIFGFRLKSVESGIQNVLREYPGSRRDDRLAAADMGDVHAFRLNLDLVFNRENC